MTAWSVFRGNTHFLAAAIVVRHLAIEENAGDSLAKAERHIQRQGENCFLAVIDEGAVIAIAISHGRESFTEIFGVRELHGNNEFSGFIDVAPFARV